MQQLSVALIKLKHKVGELLRACQLLQCGVLKLPRCKTHNGGVMRWSKLQKYYGNILKSSCPARQKRGSQGLQILWGYCAKFLQALAVPVSLFSSKIYNTVFIEKIGSYSVYHTIAEPHYAYKHTIARPFPRGQVGTSADVRLSLLDGSTTRHKVLVFAGSISVRVN